MRIKICGITRNEDARLAAELGAWALGFIFYEKSPRYIRPEAAAGIVSSLPRSVKCVGVFVNESPEGIARVAKVSGIGAAQFHGDEPVESLAMTSLETIKAVRLKSAEDLSRLPAYRPSLGFLLDAAAGESWGGSGKLSDWALAKELKSRGPLILSGGLSPANVAAAIQDVGPFAVDVCSGVESSPGIKDRGKLEEFFRHAT